MEVFPKTFCRFLWDLPYRAIHGWEYRFSCKMQHVRKLHFAQSALPSLWSISRPWATGSMTARMFSAEAFLLPGRLMINVRPRIPAALRLRQPLGVIFIDSARMASGMPGVCRSTTFSVASGVMSLGEKPVPPRSRFPPPGRWSFPPK